MNKPERFDFTAWPNLPWPYSYSDPNSSPVKSPTCEWTISGIVELWPILMHIRQAFQRQLKLPSILWFRGHGESDYVLLPSLIRVYFSKHCSCSLPQYQKLLLEKFMSRSKGSPELVDTSHLKRDNEQIEYIADMQHYGVPTNLLDWSEDISVALYFATEKDPKRQAAFYILHPYFYNFVRNTIISMYQPTSLHEEDAFNHDTANASIGGLLPNFSAHFNLTARQYQNYITGPEVFESLMEKRRWRIVDPLADKNTHAPLLPLAVQIPRSNPRLRNQSGTFLAFNLCEFPLEERLRKAKNCHGLEHVELEQIQKFYLNSDDLESYIKGLAGANYDAMRGKLPFLHKILLNPTAVSELRDMTAFLGKRQEVVYPELYNIGQQIAAETGDV